MSLESSQSLFKAPRTDISQNQGTFRTHFNFPGRNHPSHDDHGYGPLATIVESYMDSGTLIRMHQHQNEEIISWVPGGVMRHDDGEGNKLVTDPEHLLIMNAGRGFWHEERTLTNDPPLRMLQIFVRPHSLGLDPGIQHKPIDDPVPNEWRHLFGPKGSDAPLFVRNDVHFYDARLDEHCSLELPIKPDWDTYFYIFDGTITANGTCFDTTESGLLIDCDESITVTATTEDTIFVAFCINPDAAITRHGTIGQ